MRARSPADEVLSLMSLARTDVGSTIHFNLKASQPWRNLLYHVLARFIFGGGGEMQLV